MLKTKRILLLLFAVLLLLVTASCGGAKSCVECVDGDGDGACDVCNKEVQGEEVATLPLFEDGEPTFQVVLEKNVTNEVKRKANTEIGEMLRNEYDVSIDVITEGSEEDSEIDVEVLIGNVTTRGDGYRFDGHTLGKEGYAVKIIGTKIIVAGGSEEALLNAIEVFAQTLSGKEDIENLAMTEDDVTVVIQNDYKITSLKVSGTDMKGYTIAAELTRKHYPEAARMLQNAIYEDTGYWFEIVDIQNAGDKSLIIKHVDGVVGDESYKVSVKGTTLTIECAYDNYLETVTNQFITQKISTARGDLDFKDTVYTRDISVVYYDDFGAKGDGKTDDYLAIYNAHVFANESGQLVKASRNPSGKVYYIYDTRPDPENSNTAVAIPIRTNTDWQNVKFVIDDLNLRTFSISGDKNNAAIQAIANKDVFEILPSKEHKMVDFRDREAIDVIVAAGVNPSTTNINLKIDGWDGALMLIPYNSQHGVFRRRGSYGAKQYEGEDMHEVIVIDKNGNVSEETPIMFDYTNINYIKVYKLDPNSAITVGNATIETLSSRVENKRLDSSGKMTFTTNYINRGIKVSRSYTTVENINHVVSGGYTLKERANGYESCNYNGMFFAANANHVTFRNCIMPGRQQYDGHSSYNFSAICVNKIVLENCIQSNFWITVDPEEGIMHPSTEYKPGAYTSMSTVKVKDDNGKLQKIPMCWGIGGTNFCKNMEYINSQLSRFDAHEGLYNGKIINSKVNYIALTGYGEMTVEDTVWYQCEEDETLIALRTDYGCQWYGDVTVKNLKAYLYDTNSATTPQLVLVNHEYRNFYYGYTTAFPSITIDNLDVYSTKNQAPIDAGYKIALFNFASNANKMHLSENTGIKAIFGYTNKDNDKYIDEPLFDVNLDGKIDDADRIDFDGDGKVGNTSLLYADYKNVDEKTIGYGINHPECTRNLNPVKPPEFIKIINNDGVDGKGGYVYNVVNTGGRSISDGGWYRGTETPDTLGGFFGGTKFIYGEGEDEYFIGSDHVDQTETTTFKFD